MRFLLAQQITTGGRGQTLLNRARPSILGWDGLNWKFNAGNVAHYVHL